MIKKSIFIVLLLIGSSAFSGESIHFSTLSTGVYASGIDKKVEKVFYDSSSFAAFIKKIYEGTTPPPVTPNINFNKEIVIAVSPGPKMSGGYSVEIVEIANMGNKIEVIVLLHEPDPNNGVTMAITQPHHIVSVLKSEITASGAIGVIEEIPVEFVWISK